MSDVLSQPLRIVGFKRFEAMPLLRHALVASEVGILLLVASGLLPTGNLYSVFLSRCLNSVAYLLLAFGSSLLLWATVVLPDEVTVGCDYVLCIAVFLNVIYYLVAAIGSALGFHYYLYYVTLVLWWIRSLSGLFIAVDFIFFGGSHRQLAGILLVLTYVVGSPYRLPELMGFVQWGPLRSALPLCLTNI